MQSAIDGTVGVVGCGLMGAGIAEVCARSGRAVTVVESSTATAEAGRRRLERSLQRAEAKGKIDSVEEVLGRITLVDQVEALAEARRLRADHAVEPAQGDQLPARVRP